MSETDFWKRYWSQQAAQSRHSHPLSQVQRTIDRVPIPPAQIDAVCEDIVAKLQLESHLRVLDLCAGNGFLTDRLTRHCSSILAADYTLSLIAAAPAHLARVVTDAREQPFGPLSFDRILISAALQHFSESEIVTLLRRLPEILRPGGVVLITDIPDSEKLWCFHKTPQQRRTYFDELAAGRPIIGSWVARNWLRELALDAGFSDALALDQPSQLPFAHYRYDFRCHL